VPIVDDDERQLIELEALLEDQGFETTSAWGGRQALKLLKEGMHDVVILDEYLSDVPSQEILHEIYRKPIQPLVALLKALTPFGEPAFLFLPFGAHCSIGKQSGGKVVKSLTQCPSHAGPLTVRDPS
jgi:Response regulator receiver domain